MFSIIYIEEEVADHPRVISIRSRYPEVPVVYISRYGEIFNRKNQNFRLQKSRPALILARKHQHFLLEAPDNYGLGGSRNYYFSHMLNCIYDCRYCFLQGMYQSANYVLFVNYEDFQDDITRLLENDSGQSVYFYSGYDCDSLALDPVANFVDEFLPYFETKSKAVIELRTKSTQIRSLLEREPQRNCVVAFSFTPEPVANALENKVPSLQKRVDAMRKLQDKGWAIGLRFDPMIYDDNYKADYAALFDMIFNNIDAGLLHSVSLGVFRLPEPFFHKMRKLFPEEKLFAARIKEGDGLVSYGKEMEEKMLSECETLLLNYVPDSIYYPCRR